METTYVHLYSFCLVNKVSWSNCTLAFSLPPGLSQLVPSDILGADRSQKLGLDFLELKECRGVLRYTIGVILLLIQLRKKSEFKTLQVCANSWK